MKFKNNNIEDPYFYSSASFKKKGTERSNNVDNDQPEVYFKNAIKNL